MNEYPYEEENNKGWLVELYNCSENPILNMTFGQMFSLQHFLVWIWDRGQYLDMRIYL